MHYPFDRQECTLIYYVSDESYYTVELLSPDTVSVSRFIENSEWNLLEAKAKVVAEFGTNLVWNTFTIERRALFTVYTMIIPLLCLAILNVFTILVPIGSGEKGSLAFTIFLAYGFFLSITRDALPHNSTQASYYVIYVCVLLVVSVVTAVYVMIQSVISASSGDKNVNFLGRKTTVEILDSKPVTDSHDVKEDLANFPKKMTYSELLQKLDIILFIVAFVSLLVYSAVLWNTVGYK